MWGLGTCGRNRSISNTETELSGRQFCDHLPTRTMRLSPQGLLQKLEGCAAKFGNGAAQAKLDVLKELEGAVLRSARQVVRLHDLLCFFAAYPENEHVLRFVRRMLSSFHLRQDLIRHRDALAGTGIVGTTTYYRFFAPTARWLAGRWPEFLTIDWREFDQQEKLEDWLRRLALYGESPGLDEYPFTVRQWLERLKGPAETDAAFLIRRFAALPIDTHTWEMLYNALDPPLVLHPGPGTPNRTHASYPAARVCYQDRPLRRSKLRPRKAIRREPDSVRVLSAREGRKIVDLARTVMVAFSRELDVFSFGSHRDVTLVESGRGLSFALLGAVPERRLVFEAVYGYLALQNGVPVGYGTVSSLFKSSEIAFNVFAPYRGHGTSNIFLGLLSAVRHLFGSDTFTLYPYQLGEDNPEAIRSGAWWFYQKLGFRPRDAEVLALMERELKQMKRRSGHRSSAATLRRLAAANLYLHLDRKRNDVVGILPLARVGLHVTDLLARRFGSDRARASRECVREAKKLLGIAADSSGPRGQRLAWEWWAPLVSVLPDIEQWKAKEKKALAGVIDAKGGDSERRFVLQFDEHARLRRAIRKLAERPE